MPIRWLDIKETFRKAIHLLPHVKQEVKDVRYFVENFGDDITQKHSCRRDVVNQIGYGVRGLFQYNGLIVASIYEQLEVMKYLLDKKRSCRY